MIRSVALAALMCAAAFVAGAQAPDLSKLDIVEKSVPDGPVATVDGKPIDKAPFLFLYRQQIGAIKAMQPDREIPDHIRAMTGIRALAELVQREILATEGEKLGIKVDEAEVQQAFAKELEQLQKALQATEKTSLSEAEILARGGQTKEDALAEIRKELKAARMRDQIAKQKNITVTDAEIQDFYNKNPQSFHRSGGIHLKQIFVEPDPNMREATPESKAKARAALEKAMQRIKAGETFESVAKAAKGEGDLGMRPAAQLPDFYVAAAAKLQPEQMSDIIESQHGYHVIKLIATEQENSVPLAEAHDRIRQLLLKSKSEEAVDAYTMPMLDDTSRVKLFVQLEDKLRDLEKANGGKAPSAGAPSTSTNNSTAAPAPASRPAAAPAPAPAASGENLTKKERKQQEKQEKKKNN